MKRDPAADAGRAWRPSTGFLAAALGIVAGTLGYVAYAWMTPPAVVAVGGSATAQAAPVVAGNVPSAVAVPLAPAAPARAAAPPPVPAPAAGPRIVRSRDPNDDQSPDITDFVNEGERPTMNEVIERLHGAGVFSGLGAFSPPGTRPPLVGLAVPEDFPLPEGYVRHHQATDDGQRIEPILMFSPDRTFVDSAGRPIVIPKDRVVPPELAPPGLPIRRIVVPAPADAGGRAS